MKLSLGLTLRDYSVAGGAVAYDADAQAYFTANTAITSTADKNAINNFYLGLKSDGIYTKITAMYLPLWSSATNNKWNLKNPLDTNGAYRLTFSTGWTHSSSGMTPNGSSAYADTFLTTSVIGLNSGHLSYYSRTNSTGSYTEMGALQNLPNSYTDIGINFTGFGAFIRYNDNGGTTYATNANTTGFYIGSRQSNTLLKLFKNGSSILTSNNTANSTSSTRNIYIGAVNNVGTAAYFTNRQCSFSSIGTGLTDTDASNFYTRVNTLMTYFGINV